MKAISKNLQVMDAAAFALCRDQKLPIRVFSIVKSGALRRVVAGRGRRHAGARMTTPTRFGRLMHRQSRDVLWSHWNDHR